jgi:hypothetical protein
VGRAYRAYATGRRTLENLSRSYSRDIETIRRHFDDYVSPTLPISPPTHAVALTFDATFFGRGYGLMVYRAEGRNIFWQEITTETVAGMRGGLCHLIDQGWQFSSVTIDGRQGVISLLKSVLPEVPLQLCLFHQKATIRRYLTTRPKTRCGQELQNLVAHLQYIDRPTCAQSLEILWQTYGDFLRERNDAGRFVHRALRSALRSLKSNLPYLYTWQDHPNLRLPTTTNSCDGSFAHWKAKVKIHRGLRHDRRSKMIHFLLTQT